MATIAGLRGDGGLAGDNLHAVARDTNLLRGRSIGEGRGAYLAGGGVQPGRQRAQRVGRRVAVQTGCRRRRRCPSPSRSALPVSHAASRPAPLSAVSSRRRRLASSSVLAAATASQGCRLQRTFSRRSVACASSDARRVSCHSARATRRPWAFSRSTKSAPGAASSRPAACPVAPARQSVRLQQAPRGARLRRARARGGAAGEATADDHDGNVEPADQLGIGRTRRLWQLGRPRGLAISHRHRRSSSFFVRADCQPRRCNSRASRRHFWPHPPVASSFFRCPSDTRRCPQRPGRRGGMGRRGRPGWWRRPWRRPWPTEASQSAVRPPRRCASAHPESSCKARQTRR